MLFPAPLHCPALLEAAQLLLCLLAGETDLTVVPSKSLLTPALVDPPAVAPVKTGDDTLAELTVGAVVAWSAVAGVSLHTPPPVLAGAGADPALAARPLEPGGTLTQPGGRAVAAVHALGLTDRPGAMTTFPAGPADTAPGPVTVSLVLTEPLTPGVLPSPHTLLPAPTLSDQPPPPTPHLSPQSQLQRSPGQFPFPGQDFQADTERRRSCEISSAGQPDREGWKRRKTE